MDLSLAVAKTIAYGGFFNFPLSPEEIHFWLISSRPVSKEKINKLIPKQTSKDLKLKAVLQKNTQEKEKFAQKLIYIARFIPGIRLVALTGSVAANNTKKNDDLDLLIVTDNNTLWLIRPIFLLILSWKFNRRHPGDNPTNTNNAFCPNLWLDMDSLSVPKTRRNIYTAHEVLQVKPLLDRGETYQRFLKSNDWTKHFLANAYKELQKEKIKKEKINIFTVVLAPFNFIFFLLQYLYMLPKKTSEAVSLHSAYFHKNDLSVSLSNHLQTKPL